MLFIVNTCKVRKTRMFESQVSKQAYASVEHSAIRGMYVDPDRLDRSLERSI